MHFFKHMVKKNWRGWNCEIAKDIEKMKISLMTCNWTEQEILFVPFFTRLIKKDTLCLTAHAEYKTRGTVQYTWHQAQRDGSSSRRRDATAKQTHPVTEGKPKETARTPGNVSPHTDWHVNVREPRPKASQLQAWMGIDSRLQNNEGEDCGQKQKRLVWLCIAS